MHYWFTSLGVGRFAAAARRIQRQAVHLDIFATERISVLHEVPSEWFDDAEELKPDMRGYAYWFWKPRLVERMLERMPMGDVLIYADSGCDLNKTEDWNRWLSIASAAEVAALRLMHTNEAWTKEDIFCAVGIQKNSAVRTDNMYAATFASFRKTPATMRFVRRWRELCTNYHLVSDEASIAPNAAVFYENRHDQSLFSVLLGRLRERHLLDVRPLPGDADGGEYYGITVPISSSRNPFEDQVMLRAGQYVPACSRAGCANYGFYCAACTNP